VGLDQAGGDLQLGAQIAAVDPDRHGPGTGPQEQVLRTVPAVMVLEAIAQTLDHVAVGQLDLKPRATIIQADSHPHLSATLH